MCLEADNWPMFKIEAQRKTWVDLFFPFATGARQIITVLPNADDQKAFSHW